MMTPEYASPEQVRNESISTVSDLYSLGVLLYELLSGELPYYFEKRTPVIIENIICNRIPEIPSHKPAAKHINVDLDSIILKALKKEPSDLIHLLNNWQMIFGGIKKHCRYWLKTTHFPTGRVNSFGGIDGV